METVIERIGAGVEADFRRVDVKHEIRRSDRHDDRDWGAIGEQNRQNEVLNRNVRRIGTARGINKLLC